MSKIHIGTSGWSYNHWQGILYPENTPSVKRLDYYLERYQTVELNSSYYRWPADTAFTRWKERLPEKFLMTVKAPRILTHYKRLLNPQDWLPRMTHALQLLGNKLGILLVQLSPKFPCNLERIDNFLGQVPKWIRVAMEFRHPSWHEEPVFNILERHHVAYCVMSGANLPCILRATASFVYLRLHGPDPNGLYGGSYSDEDLKWWADRIIEWRAMDKEIFVYFNNDGGGNALRNADTLKRILNVG